MAKQFVPSVESVVLEGEEKRKEEGKRKSEDA
jgi:hypothetical protein